MFDVLQISWWFLQLTVVGYLCTYRLFRDDTDRLLFAPVTGLGAGILVSSTLWLWSFPSHSITFVLTVALGGGIACIIRTRPKPSMAVVKWLLAGVLLVTLHGSLIPFTEKLWQGYPLDRFGFLNAHILFQQHNLKYFMDAVHRLGRSGDKSVMFIHPVITAAWGEMRARPACGLIFGSLAWLTPYDLHQLGNAWEVCLRVVQFSCVLALFYKVLGSRFLTGFLAVGTIFSYWFQYQKDYNSWPHMITMAFIIGIITLMISIVKEGRVIGKERYLIYMLAVAMIVNHAEFGLVLCLGLGIVVASNPVLRKEFLARKVFVLELAACVGLIFTAHPFIMGWIHRMFLQSPVMVGGESSQARGLYCLFGSGPQLFDFTRFVVAHPLHLIFNPAAFSDLIIGLTGLSFVTYLGSRITLGVTLLLIALACGGGFCLGSQDKKRLSWAGGLALVLALLGLSFILSRSFLPNLIGVTALNVSASIVLGVFLLSLLITSVVVSKEASLKVMLVLTLFHFAFFFGSLLAFQWFGVMGAGAAYRSLAYWGAFASMTLYLYMASTNIPIFKVLAVLLVTFDLIFGFSIFWVANRGGMETYPDFYPNRCGYRHFEVPTVRDKYDYDYRDLIKPLRHCNLVFLDFKDTQSRGLGRFHAVNLMNFLDNNDIRYRLGFPYLNGYQLLSDAYYPGFKAEEVNADCTVDEEVRNGRISYRLTVKDWR